MARILKWVGGGLAVILVLAGLGAAYFVHQFNTQNFVADKSDPDYANRVEDLWPAGAVPYYKDPGMTPDTIKFPYNLDADDAYELVPNMVSYPILDGAPKAAVVIYPGGGYLMRAEKHEGVKIARFLNTHGIAAFVVNYRLAPYRHPIPLLDAEQALRLVREGADRFNIDPARVGVMGFSAGGHLAALVSNHADPRPAFAMLGYGVIAPTTTQQPMIGNMYFKGEENAPTNPDVSPDLMINDQTPPTFIWHTKQDPVVDVAQSIAYDKLLTAQGIPVETHLFDNGGHGLGLAETTEGTKEWPYLFVTWLKTQGFVKDGSAFASSVATE